MAHGLISDLKNDESLNSNLIKVVIFTFFFFIIDYLMAFFLLKGVEHNYGLKSDADVLMIGHSHLMLAVDKVLLEERSGLRVAKYTREGVNIADRKVMLKHYFSTCREKPEIVVLGVDPWLFTGEGLSKNSWMLFLPFMDSPEISYYIKKSAPRKFDYFRYKYLRSSRFNAVLLNASIRGWLNNWDNLKFGVVDTSRYKNEETLRIFRPVTFSRELMDDFSSTLDFLNGENVRVILLNTPVWQPLINAEKQEYEKSMFLIDSLKQKHCPDSEIIDMLPHFTSRTELFFDPIHLNHVGQKIVTEYFAAILDSIVKGRDFGDVNEK